MAQNDQEWDVMLRIALLEPECFEDFTFELFSLASDYFRNGDLGYTLGLSKIKVSISEAFEMSAFDSVSNTLRLLPEHAQNEAVLLHEMIHAFEYQMSDLIPALREILTLQLYKKLQKKHPDLDTYLDNFLTRSTFKEIAEQGGPHGALFALKALDIDDRKGWKPGTTFGYVAYTPEAV